MRLIFIYAYIFPDCPDAADDLRMFHLLNFLHSKKKKALNMTSPFMKAGLVFRFSFCLQVTKFMVHCYAMIRIRKHNSLCNVGFH